MAYIDLKMIPWNPRLSANPIFPSKRFEIAIAPRHSFFPAIAHNKKDPSTQDGQHYDILCLLLTMTTNKSGFLGRSYLLSIWRRVSLLVSAQGARAMRQGDVCVGGYTVFEDQDRQANTGSFGPPQYSG